MLTPTLRKFALTAAATTLLPLTALAAAPAANAVGPDCNGFDTILRGQYPFISLPNKAMLTQERCGYRFRAGQQNSHLEVTQSNGGLMFRDTGTGSWKSVEAPCEKVNVSQGVAAWCPVPGETSPSNPMLLEIWPRLGNDYVDASSLPAKFQVAALMDGGRDTVLGGAGDDFVNGAFGPDTIDGGGGDDWLRSGSRADKVDGGPGDDKLITQAGSDVVDGGQGSDRIYAGSGRDTVRTGDSVWDLANCGGGRDRSEADGGDKRRRCEVRTLWREDTGGSTGGDTGGSTGGDTGGSTGGDTGGSTGGDTGGSTGGDTGGSTGGDSTSQSEWGQGPLMFSDGTTTLPKEAGKYPGYGPSKPYVQEILTNDVVPMKDQAMINPVPNGYLVRGGQQNNDMTMSVVNGRLQIVDPATREWKGMPSVCRNISVPQGVGASCEIPSFFTTSNPMLIEVWPRLGDDTLDTTALSSAFDISYLGDKGDDVARFGDGDDFFNGAQDNDTVRGGDGRDWLRTGIGADWIDGQGGDDMLLGVHDDDTIYGGPGDDNLQGGGGADSLYAGSGNDRVGCGDGVDLAWLLRTDNAYQCETLNYS